MRRCVQTFDWYCTSSSFSILPCLIFREPLSFLTCPQCWRRRDSGNLPMNSTLKTSSITGESLLNQKPSCHSLQVSQTLSTFIDWKIYWRFDWRNVIRLWRICVFTCRSSYVSRRGSGSYGALPHCGNASEEVQVHLARRCRRARLHACFWFDPDP